jgi:hypothetical protein
MPTALKVLLWIVAGFVFLVLLLALLRWIFPRTVYSG